MLVGRWHAEFPGSTPPLPERHEIEFRSDASGEEFVNGTLVGKFQWRREDSQLIQETQHVDPRNPKRMGIGRVEYELSETSHNEITLESTVVTPVPTDRIVLTRIPE